MGEDVKTLTDEEATRLAELREKEELTEEEKTELDELVAREPKEETDTEEE